MKNLVKIIAPMIFISTSLMTPAFANQNVSISEREWYADFEAFNITVASQSPNCQTLLLNVNAERQTHFKSLLIPILMGASACLREVREETPDYLPTIVPRTILAEYKEIERKALRNK